MTGKGVRLARLAVTALGLAMVAWALSAGDRWPERHLLASYCATTRAGWLAARSLRWVVGVSGALAIWRAPAMARRVGRWSPRPGSVLGVVLALAAALGATELYMRHQYRRLVLGAGLMEPRHAAPMFQMDARLGWSHVPSRTTWAEYGGRRVAYAIDASGARADAADRPPERAAPAILFTGESIAFGWGLQYEESVPVLVERQLGIHTVNLAAGAYGTDQAFLRLLDELSRATRPVAVVTLFIPDQIGRNVNIWRPRLVLRPGGALELAPPSGPPRIARLLQELPFHGDGALEVTAAVLRATADAARARGAVPLFVVTNYGAACLPDAGGEPWVVDQLFVRQGLPFVRVELEAADRLPGWLERHPGPRGAQKIAAAVARALREPLALDGRSPRPSAASR